MAASNASVRRNQESPLGTVIESRYDKVGNRIEQRQPVQGSVVAVTKYRYDALNRLKETEDPLKGISKQTYDEDGRLRETEDASGVKTTMDYDVDGSFHGRATARSTACRRSETRPSDVPQAPRGLDGSPRSPMRPAT